MESEFTLKKLFIFIGIMIFLLVFVSFGVSSIVKDLTATNINLSKKDIREAARTYSSNIDDDLWKETDEYEVFCVTVGELVNRGLLGDGISFDDDVVKSDFVMVKRNKFSLEIKDVVVTKKDDNGYKICKEFLPKVKYTVTFHKGAIASKIGQGNSDVITKECISYGNESCAIESPSIIVDSGYSALGWNTDREANSGIYDANSQILVNGNTDYYAIVKANTVSIRYNAVDGKIAYTSNASGVWSKNTDGTILLNGSPLSTIIFYGKSLSSVGLEDYNDSNRMYVGKSGYYVPESEEWLCISGCHGTFSQSRVYSYKDFCDSEIKDCEVVLGVNWKRANYTVKYNANGGENAPDNQLKEVGNYVYLSSKIPVRSGYTFNGWNTKVDGSGTNYNPGDFYSEDSNLTLYAKWTLNSTTTYKVTYNANGGDGGPNSQIKISGISLTLSTTVPVRSGYTFKGWNTKIDGSGTNYNAGSIYNINSNLTLYAQWSKKAVTTYSISYIGNGGSGAPASQTKDYGSYIYISTTVPVRNGYTFKGWNTKVDGSGTNYNPGSIYSANKDVVLYAQWTIIPSNITYTITYNANGGSGAPSTQIKTQDIPIYLSSVTPTKSSYTFIGWNTSASGNGMTYSAGAYYNGNANLKLFAQWKPNTSNTVSSHVHDIKAIGNTLRTIEKTKLSCGHEHTVALYRYCSICSRAAYLILVDEMYACPCRPSYTTIFNDSLVGNFSTYKSWLGGVVSGYYSLDKTTSITKECSEH